MSKEEPVCHCCSSLSIEAEIIEQFAQWRHSTAQPASLAWFTSTRQHSNVSLTKLVWELGLKPFTKTGRLEPIRLVHTNSSYQGFEQSMRIEQKRIWLEEDKSCNQSVDWRDRVQWGGDKQEGATKCHKSWQARVRVMGRDSLWLTSHSWLVATHRLEG